MHGWCSPSMHRLCSTETLIVLSTLSLKDVTGRLTAIEDHAETTMMMVGSKLLPAEEEWVVWEGCSGLSSHSGMGKRRGKTP